MRRILILCFLLINLSVFGQTQNALSFDGSNDYVIVADNNAIDFGTSTDFTIEAWIRLNASNPDYAGIVVKGSSGLNWAGYQLVLVGNRIAAEIKDGTTQAGVSDGLQGSTNLNDGKWHHVAMVVTRSTTNAKLYVDGVQEADVTKACLGNNVSNAADMFIGVERTPVLYFNGNMDEVRVWNTARTVNELRNNRNREVNGASSGLVAYYKFNSASGTTLSDATSNGLNGTLTNFALTGSTSNWIASSAGFTPTITSLSTYTGIVGSSVTISGTHFNEIAANNIVYFGATMASTPTSVTSTSLTVTVPVGAIYAPVTVVNTTNGLSATSLSKFLPTYPNGKGVNFTASDFASNNSINLGSQNQSITLGDVDGDGKSDLITNQNYGSQIAIARNTSSIGSVSFASTFTSSIGGSSETNLSFGDLDGDGKGDIAVCNNGANTVSFFRNTSSSGSISLATRQTSATGGNPRSVSFGDFDGDGKMDMVVSNSGTTTASVFLNQSSSGTISFAAKTDITTGSNPYLGIPVADFDGDGKLDFAVVNRGSGTISILRNTSNVGSLSFATKVDISTNATPHWLTSADFDGDGLEDLAVCYESGSVVSVFRNTSTSGVVSFASKQDMSTTSMNTYSSVTTADFNGDSKNDLMVYSFNGKAALLLNTGSSGTISFASFLDINTSAYSWGGTSGDIDGDGMPDIVQPDYGGFAVYIKRTEPAVFYSQGSGNPATTSNWNSRANGSGSAPANMAQATSYIIQNGHTMTTAGAFSFGTSGSVLQIQNGGTFTASHAVTMASSSTLQIESGGTFNSNVNQSLGAINMVGGKLNIGAGTTLTLNGTVTSTSGVFSGSATSDLTIGAAVGTLLFDQTTPGSTNMIRTLTIGAGSASSMTIGNALIIAPLGSVTFNASGTKTLTTGGNLTLRSTSAGTASIRNTNGATISGNVTVERFVPNTRRAFRFLASPVTTSDIWSNWQESGNSTAGFGTHITGLIGVSPGGNDATTGLDRTTHGNNSMFTCTASTWSAITNTKSTALTTGVGYRIFVRGDRTINLYATPDATPNNTTLRATGTLATGDFSTAALPTGYALVGNPYASEIDWNASGWNTIRTNANISNAIYIYRPAIASSATANANQYAAYVGGTGTNGGVQYIASGQAFFVQVTSGTPVLSFTEAYKTSTGAAGQFKKSPLVNHLRVGYAKDNEHVDEIVVRFMPDAKMVFDHNYDANSLNSEVFGLYSIKDTNHLAIQGRPNFTKEDIVKLALNADIEGNFSLKFSETETFDNDIEIGLKDKFLGKTFAIKGNSSYPFSITADTNSKGSSRFELVFTKMTNGVKTNMEEISAFSLYPNPASKEVNISLNRKLEGVCSFVVFNELGQEQMAGSMEFGAKATQSIQIDPLPSGVYFVRLQMNNSTQTIKFIK